MGNEKFTSGPWKAETLTHEYSCASGVEYTVKGANGEFIATVWATNDAVNANQKLIARAPEMDRRIAELEMALVDILECSTVLDCDEYQVNGRGYDCEEVEEIIKKVRGK